AENGQRVPLGQIRLKNLVTAGPLARSAAAGSMIDGQLGHPLLDEDRPGSVETGKKRTRQTVDVSIGPLAVRASRTRRGRTSIHQLASCGETENYPIDSQFLITKSSRQKASSKATR